MKNKTYYIAKSNKYGMSLNLYYFFIKGRLWCSPKLGPKSLNNIYINATVNEPYSGINKEHKNKHWAPKSEYIKNLRRLTKEELFLMCL